MEAFRKWWDKHWDSKYRGPMRGDMKQAWRAALEEVLKVCEMYEEDWDHSISDWIKQELGE